MEESFEEVEGVLEVISGYSGGTTENPTYKEVTYGNTGHFEAIKIEYDAEIVNYEKLLNIFWLNIDPFDALGQLIFIFSSVIINESWVKSVKKDQLLSPR